MNKKGFTLIELVTVIVVVTILGVFALPRLTGNDDLAVISARDAGLSVARQVQLKAIQQADPKNACHQLVVTASQLGGNPFSGCENKSSQQVTFDGVSVSPAKTLSFDLLGRPYDAISNTRLSDILTFTFSKNGATASLCLNPEGYFYACD
ncbi:prepilin-type N-terminal cleavage/methylation domain-containing protein [Veronia pacifica]|uniref:MSHA biogenesis protein MshC n=1 Tax=Veronia pacifica TaxID=1080227 RepID=A0A1C3ELP2_9GAMM|nr:prepilin-type N-terminal cleavage/methylation domain-containing protein [Veronia pacifica]ODA34145.1 hypothetical protein A8L45_07650 [Veronia pacifica]